MMRKFTVEVDLDDKTQVDSVIEALRILSSSQSARERIEGLDSSMYRTFAEKPSRTKSIRISVQMDDESMNKALEELKRLRDEADRTQTVLGAVSCHTALGEAANTHIPLQKAQGNES